MCPVRVCGTVYHVCVHGVRVGVCMCLLLLCVCRRTIKQRRETDGRATTGPAPSSDRLLLNNCVMLWYGGRCVLRKHSNPSPLRAMHLVPVADPH